MTETRFHFHRRLSGGAGAAICILALLLSCFWPAFTYWGVSHYRRNAFIGTYVLTKSYTHPPPKSYTHPPSKSYTHPCTPSRPSWTRG